MWCRSTRRCSFLCVFFLWWSILSKPFRVTNLFSLSKVVHLSIAWLEGIYKAHKVKTGPAMLTYKNSWKQWYIRAHTFISKIWYIWNELWADVGVCIFNKSRNDISFLKNLFIEVLADLQCVNFCCRAKWFRYIYISEYIYIYPHICTFFFIFFSITVYHRILNIGPCAIQ